MIEENQFILFILFGPSLLTSIIGIHILHQWKGRTEKQLLVDKIILLFLVISFTVPLALFTVGEIYQTTVIDKNGDVSNWAALVIEVGIGIAIGSTIFVYSNFKQEESSGDIITVKAISEKINDMLDTITPIVYDQGEQEKRRKKKVIDDFISNFEHIN